MNVEKFFGIRWRPVKIVVLECCGKEKCSVKIIH